MKIQITNYSKNLFRWSNRISFACTNFLACARISFVFKNSCGFSSSSFLFGDNSTKIDTEDNSENSDVNYLYFNNFTLTECFKIENFFEDSREIRERDSEFPYSEYS
jgi:hypothetical protein